MCRLFKAFRCRETPTDSFSLLEDSPQTINRKDLFQNRISYRVEILPHKKCQDSNFGGFFFNSPDPMSSRIAAFKIAQDNRNYSDYGISGEYDIRIFFIDEHTGESRIIYDGRLGLTGKICRNLEFEFELIKSLGHDIPDWEVVADDQGKGCRMICNQRW